MSDLFNSIEDLSRSLKPIPPSQGFWLNRTNKGVYYDDFIKRKIVGLDIDLITLDELSKIRNATLKPNKRPNYDSAQIAIIEFIHNKYKRRINDAGSPEKKASEKAKLTLKANQIFHFTFLLKKGDFVVIPSELSATISIGRVKDPYLDNPSYLPLQRRVAWLGHYRRHGLDPNFFRAFFSHQAFTSIEKHRDVVLRTLYDFYIDGGKGHLVLNLGSPHEISFADESAFLFYLSILLEKLIKEKKLPYNINDLNTIVNLNSKGKRKLFGPPNLVTLVSIVLLFVVGGGLESKYGNFSLKTDGLIQEISKFLDNQERRKIARELNEKADSLDLEKQESIHELIKELDTDK